MAGGSFDDPINRLYHGGTLQFYAHRRRSLLCLCCSGARRIRTFVFLDHGMEQFLWFCDWALLCQLRIGGYAHYLWSDRLS